MLIRNLELPLLCKALETLEANLLYVLPPNHLRATKEALDY